MSKGKLPGQGGGTALADLLAEAESALNDLPFATGSRDRLSALLGVKWQLPQGGMEPGESPFALPSAN